MAETESRAKKGTTAGRVSLWVILGLLIVGLMGFGATGLSGTVRSIGSVGDKDITTQSYFTALQSEISQVQRQFGRQVTFLEAQQLGLDRAALQQLVIQRSLDHEATVQGLSVGDDRVRDVVLSIPGFQALDGGFDRVAYGDALRRNGLSERDFETTIREEQARNLLRAAVVAGIEPSEAYGDAVVTFLAERRSFTWARLDDTSLEAPIGAPSEAELQTYYDANPAAFTLPETKRLSYAWITPSMILDQVPVDDALILDLYDQRRDFYVRPERRLVERLVFGTEAEAAAARDQVASGETSFEEVVTARGLRLQDIDLGDVTPADLATDAQPMVFGASVGDVVGPAQSSLGPALYRVNAVLPAQEITFEEARDDLQDELAQDTARRQIQASREDIDNLLAGGALVSELTEVDMEVGTIDWRADVSEGIAAYEAFRAAAAQIADGDFPEVLELEDGGLFSIELIEVLPPALQPLDDVREAATAAWTLEAQATALDAQARALLPELGAGANFGDLGLEAVQEVELTRSGFVPDTPPSFLTDIFALSEGETAVIQDLGTILVVRLDSILPPDADDPQVGQLQDALTQELQVSIANDAFEAFARSVQTSAGINLNQQAINAVNAQIP